MKIILIGATGTIGSAVKDLFEAHDHEVVAASRRAEHRVDLENPESIRHLFAAVGPVDAVVSAAGDAPFGDIRDLEDDRWDLALRSKLMGQVNLVRYGRGNTKKGFILTGGTLAHSPWPRTSAIATVNAALEGFVKGAAADLRHEKRVAVVHPPLLAETAKHLGMDAAKFPGARTVAEAYLAALEGDDTGAVYYVDGYHPRR